MILAATGHRPNKLGGYAPHIMRATRAYALACLYETKPDVVFTGMAQGWDTAMADAALTLGIPFVACIPFKGQEDYWQPNDRRLYKALIAEAEDVEVICKRKPARQDHIVNAFHNRNELMVDSCDLLLALWDGTESGTAHCVRYAEKQLRPILHVWDGFWMNNIPF